MSKQIENSLFMLPPSTLKQTGFYQDLLRGISSYKQLGNRLIHLAEQAHVFRRYDSVKEYGQILSNFPIRAYQAIGYYYLAIFYNNCGNGDLERAKELLTLVADTAPLYYRAKAMLSLAAVSAHLKKTDTELYYFTETLKVSKDMTIGLNAYQGIAIHKAKQGHRKQALSDLENILPLAHYAPPHVYFNYLNSLAVELGEANRKQEARNISRIVLASPYLFAYPEWRETAEDLKPPRRSFVTIGLPPSNVLAMPEPEPSEQPTLQPKPARVLSYAKWKKKMDKKNRDKQIEKSVAEMSMKEMGFKLLELITSNQANEEQMRTILIFVINLLSTPVKPPSPSA